MRLSSELQLHFKKASLNPDVAEVVSGWFGDGAPLGLTLEMFSHVLALQKDARPFFIVFDTDRNQKVDAFELLSAFTILSTGELDDKIEVIFSIFDFAGSGHLNFDETNILVHSVYRGLRKVCFTDAVDENEIVEICRRLFDSCNVPYDKHITKEQMRRWLRADVEVASFINLFHTSLVTSEVEADLAGRQQIQLEAFSNLRGPPSAASIKELLQNQAFSASLGSCSDEARLRLVDLLWTTIEIKSAATYTDPPVVNDVRKALRAWNVFSIWDSDAEGEVDAKELPNLVFFQEEDFIDPTKGLENIRGHLGTSANSRICRHSWIEAIMRD
jgi:hypothetical protein